ncbi:hypothetical protein, partial [uncultured Arthrobacter sp.]|uniref:hypothetical protein n=1 Tax=uncultured Arthrobacter sp. TaxID=114050 RepID=UPI0025E648D6
GLLRGHPWSPLRTSARRTEAGSTMPSAMCFSSGWADDKWWQKPDDRCWSVIGLLGGLCVMFLIYAVGYPSKFEQVYIRDGFLCTGLWNTST